MHHYFLHHCFRIQRDTKPWLAGVKADIERKWKGVENARILLEFRPHCFGPAPPNASWWANGAQRLLLSLVWTCEVIVSGTVTQILSFYLKERSQL
ncbi:hypothetical protein AAFF_G00098920 [Aldrovandia affinis]|uniref:Uncharacterized protein n=1 Tax=Aldrovandia affinis TaxID=143900 RepID=A0AAD7WBG6_9TELE|nr:hypothetical protein AAFF_G00098920 [Aldrovandia affinis]